MGRLSFSGRFSTSLRYNQRHLRTTKSRKVEVAEAEAEAEAGLMRTPGNVSPEALFIRRICYACVPLALPV